VNFKQIESFLWVAELQSFTKAARHLYMSQPAVSFQIKALEEDMAVVLFKRGDKKMVLTDAGEILYKEAKHMFRHYQIVKNGLDDLRGLKTGQIIIGASTEAGESMLPLLISDFLKDYRGVKISLKVAGSTQVAHWVNSREVDFGFTGMPAQGTDIDSYPWLKDELQLIVPANHRWVGLESIRAADLVEEYFIFRGKGSGTRQFIEKRFGGKVDLEQIPKGLEMGSSRAVVAAVEAGAGVSIVSRHAAREAIALGQVKAVPVADVELSRYIYQVHHRQSLGGFVTKTFIDHLNSEEICQKYGLTKID
jgi:DNA-binding transcriptional LysR family regulator